MVCTRIDLPLYYIWLDACCDLIEGTHLKAELIQTAACLGRFCIILQHSCCEDGMWVELAQDFDQWQVLILTMSFISFCYHGSSYFVL